MALSIHLSNVESRHDSVLQGFGTGPPIRRKRTRKFATFAGICAVLVARSTKRLLNAGQLRSGQAATFRLKRGPASSAT